MALVIEDGTGIFNAEAYCSVAFADNYHALYGNDAWLDLDENEKEIALRKASRDIDLMYADSFVGRLYSLTQALQFPRLGFQFVPSALMSATAELALLTATVDVLGPDDGSGNVKSFTKKVGDVEISGENFAPTSPVDKQMKRIRLMLSPLLSPGNSGAFVPVVRG